MNIIFFYLRFLVPLIVFDYMFKKDPTFSEFRVWLPPFFEFFAKLNKKCKDAHYFMKPFLH